MNCKVLNSKYQVLRETAESKALNESLSEMPLGDGGDRRENLLGMTPVDLHKKIKKVVETNRINLILILDEVDQVRKGGGFDDLVYSLTRMNDELSSGNVSIIGISNDMRVVKKLDPRTKSTLCEEEMVFKPYNAEELETILKQRVYDLGGFQDGGMDDAAIELISVISAQDGDARRALRLLKKSGEIAQNNGDKVVVPEHVEKAKKLLKRI